MVGPIKLLTVVLLSGLLFGCSAPVASQPARVAYLVQSGGQLSQTELAGHPEILVTNSYTEFKQAARRRIALWIDKNATQLVDLEWINSMPQTSYPIFVIGYNDPLLSFRDRLPVGVFLGPPLAPTEISKADGGFSVIKRDSNAPGAQITMVAGFKQPPTVERLLNLSNDLLDGKIPPNTYATP